MTLRKISTIFILLFSSFAFSQNLFGVSGSYSNQSGNFAKLGLFYTFGLGDTFITPRIDANANMAYMRDNFHVIPEIGSTSVITKISPQEITYKSALRKAPDTIRTSYFLIYAAIRYRHMNHLSPYPKSSVGKLTGTKLLIRQNQNNNPRIVALSCLLLRYCIPLFITGESRYIMT